MRPFTPQRASQPPPTFDAGYATPEGMRQAPSMRYRMAQNKLDRQTGQGGYAPIGAPGSDKDPMHAQGGPYQKLLPGQTLSGGGSGGGANPVGGNTIAPGNVMVNGQMKFVGSPDYGGTNGPTAQGKHIGSKPRRYGNADDYYADHSNLRDLHAENSIDPVTGMKIKPSSFDMESKRAELARNGEWDALARLNSYTRAQASGDPQAIGSAREDITNFRAIRQAKQQYGSGPADKGAFAEDTRPPGDFSAPGSLRVNPFARDTRAPGDFGGGVDGGVGAMQTGNPYTRDTRAPGDFGGGGLAPEAGPQAPHPWLRNPYSLSNRGVGPLAPSSESKPEDSYGDELRKMYAEADKTNARLQKEYDQKKAAQLEEEAQSPAEQLIRGVGKSAANYVRGARGLQKDLYRTATTIPRFLYREASKASPGTWFRGDPEKRAEAQRLREQYR